jgi:hypothetical protein
MDQAFRGRGIEESNESQALITNLATVPESAWHALPTGTARSIAAITLHVGACKVMYDDYGFGSQSLLGHAGGPAVAGRRSTHE